ncbi:MAG: hypothetical protein A2Z04_07545 [Chloroflexi bacterium RBG_16_57_9]|nr:MAG: hypothetical protein A2Z04_07545 [Chloroflexi bacterium RBG_16_57_9]
MEQNSVVTAVRQHFPEAVLSADEFRGQTTLVLRKPDLVQVCQFLRDDPQLRFDTLLDVTAVDWLPDEPRFEVVYHLRSLPNRGFLRLKVMVEGNHPQVPTLTSVWPTANWHERETYDMFGILFDAGMQVTDIGGDVADPFAVELHDQAQNTVGARVLRSHVDRHRLGERICLRHHARLNRHAPGQISLGQQLSFTGIQRDGAITPVTSTLEPIDNLIH